MAEQRQSAAVGSTAITLAHGPAGLLGSDLARFFSIDLESVEALTDFKSKP
jgi:hypothetical protein